jgi:hypothetical protein
MLGAFTQTYNLLGGFLFWCHTVRKFIIWVAFGDLRIGAQSAYESSVLRLKAAARIMGYARR